MFPLHNGARHSSLPVIVSLITICSGPVIVAVAVCIQTQGVANGCNLNTNGIPDTQATANVTSVAVNNGVITVVPTATTNVASTLVLAPVLGAGGITWNKAGSGCLAAQAPAPILCTL